MKIVKGSNLRWIVLDENVTVPNYAIQGADGRWRILEILLEVIDHDAERSETHWEPVKESK